ncbi:uncharacterized protein ACN427_003804 isoform 3-T3 [Glossina fuscipes fuscipes]
MVRQERRSMAISASSRMCVVIKKTRRTRYLFHGMLMVICVLQVQHIAFAYETEIANMGQRAHQPKFGERLLPLRKTNVNFHGSLNVGTNKSGVSSRAATNAERNVYSLLHKSNYLVSQEKHEKARRRIEAVNNISQDSETFTLPMSTLDDTYDTITTMPSKREAKQLNRREDANVVDMVAVLVSNISKADRLVEMSTEFFIVPTSSPALSLSSSSAASRVIGSKARGLQNFIQPTVQSPDNPRSVIIVATKNSASVNSSTTQPTIVSTHPNFAGLRKEPWVVPVLVLAALTMFMMVAFEIFVLFKAWRTSPSRRHVFLGQMLLLGLFACAGLGALITAQPSLLSCGTVRFGVGVAYALVFAALLVKCVFLISLNGGVYLPAPYLGLLLLFAVLIQVVIGTQWLITQPPEIYTQSVPAVSSSMLASTMASHSERSSSPHFTSVFHNAANNVDVYARVSSTGTVLIPLCKTQYSELLFSLIYIIFLIIFVAVLAIKSRGIRDNYREAPYIGLAIGGAIPIWLGWMLCGLAVAERHKDACIAFGLVATSATVFLVMFMPKGRQLAAMGKEGLYVEDRDEQFSSISRGGSGYSPSFFHFKPIKYGVMGGGGAAFQNSTSTTAGNAANFKHVSNGLNSGGIFIRPDETNVYTTLEPTLSSNPNVYFQRGGAVHPGMMY